MELQKPKINEPCNGCGVCCKIQVCRNGAYVQRLVSTLGDTVPGPCPALMSKADGSYACGIVINPKKYIKGTKYTAEVLSKHFGRLISVGTGCDEIGEDYENEEENRKLDNLIEVMMQDEAWKDRAQQSLKIIHNL